jgi:hypothetical protein
MWCRYPFRERTHRREGMVIVTAQDARQPPERIGNNSHFGTMAHRFIVYMIVVVTHAGHDKRSTRAKRGV